MKEAQIVLRIDAPSGCAVHKDCDAPVLNRHHVVPQSWNPTENRIEILCGTAHQTVHYAIDLLVKALEQPPPHPGPPWSKRRKAGAKARAMAVEGFDWAIRQGLTPRPTL